MRISIIYVRQNKKIDEGLSMGLLDFLNMNKKSQDQIELGRQIDIVTRDIDEQMCTMTRLEETENKISKTRATIHDTRRSYTGRVPLTLFYDMCRALGEDPDQRFPQLLREAETDNYSAERDVLELKDRIASHLQLQQKKVRLLKIMLQCAGAPEGSLDAEVFSVLKATDLQGVEITTDEAVGMALANLYRRFGLSELSQRAVRGRFALREMGNCAVDVVFDPKLRKKMAQSLRQLGGHWGGRHSLMKQYLQIAECSDDYSSVNAYRIKSHYLRDLPAHILYGLVIFEPGHVVRILDVENDGLRTVEGNYDGHLNFGRFIPFTELAGRTDHLVVYSRQSGHRLGVEEELITYDYTNPDATGYDSLKKAFDDLGSFEHFKLASDKLFFKLPVEIRDSLLVLRFRVGKAYHTTPYNAFVEDALKLFPCCDKKKLIAAFVKEALSNPTGMMVVLSTVRSSYSAMELPGEAARQMYIYFNKEGGEEMSLHQCRQIIAQARKKINCEEDLRFYLLTADEFTAMDEDTKQKMSILTPRKDHTGHHVDVDPHYELQLFRIPQGFENQALLMENEEGGIVPLADLMQNPIQALIIMEYPFYVLGVASRLSAGDKKLLERDAIQGTEEQCVKIIQRAAEIRHQHRRT